jgi:HSP20 family protein
MALVRWDPFREMMSLRNAMDRLLEESFVRPLRGWPERVGSGLGVSVDMYETDDDLVINAELPGLKAEDVDISITGNTLTLKGEFQTEEEGERGDVHFQERRYGKFQRSIPLPMGIDTEATEAEFEDGVLKVRLPKPEETKPKQITVRAKS